MIDYLKNLTRDELCFLIGDICCLAMLLVVALALITLAP